jgi:alkylation response protein AidB-like acyl-CoA dehydrogenase
MDLELSPGDRAFRDRFRRWLRANRPRAWRHGPHGQEPASGEDLAALRAWQRRLHAGGWLGLGWPEAYGGHAGTALRQMLVNEELASNAPGIVGLLGVALVAPTLLAFGSEEQKLRFLPRILSAEELWCQGYSEPGAGSDLASLRTLAVVEGDELVVRGQKIWTSNAHFADWMFALVRSDPEAPRHRGLSYLLLPMRSPGVTVRPLVQMTGEARLNQVFLEDVRVPLANVVGGLGNGWAVANATLGHERDMLGAASHARNLLTSLLRVARSARRGGRPALEDPVLRRRLADLEIRVAAMRLHSLRGLADAERGRPPGIAASVTKLATTWLNFAIAETALELLGPFGTLAQRSRRVTDRGFWPHELMFSLGMILGGGTSQIQKNVIAQRGLGLPRGH